MMADRRESWSQKLATLLRLFGRPCYRRDVRLALTVSASLAVVGLASAIAACAVSTLPSGGPNATSAAAPLPTFRIGPKGANADDAPEISRSTGVRGGFVIMWPRMLPENDPDLQLKAAKVQHRLAVIAHEAFPDAAIDVRPEPEKVCPRDGCEGVVLGIIMKKRESGCIIAAFTAKHGQSDSLIVPWVGAVEAKGPAPFREPPESYLTIHKYGSCATIDDSLKSNGAVGDETAVVAAVKAAKE